MNFLAASNSFWTNLITRLSQWNVIVGFVLAVSGLLLSIFARKLTGKIKHIKEVDNGDKLFFSLKLVSLGLVIAGLVFTVIK
ncbi:MAG TPA: hypothetical protein VIL26_07845 [Clostridia bacterium]